jgi:hypothetical protein
VSSGNKEEVIIVRRAANCLQRSRLIHLLAVLLDKPEILDESEKLK